MSRSRTPSTIRASQASSTRCSTAWRTRRSAPTFRDNAMARRGRIGEFELIARYFAPLAKGFAGARGLKSDNAFLVADGRHDLVVKTDTIVSGVHFLVDEKPERIAAKALRV